MIHVKETRTQTFVVRRADAGDGASRHIDTATRWPQAVRDSDGLWAARYCIYEPARRAGVTGVLRFLRFSVAPVKPCLRHLPVLERILPPAMTGFSVTRRV